MLLRPLALVMLSSLVACQSLDIDIPSPQTYGLKSTLHHEKSHKTLKQYIACISPTLRDTYPASSLKSTTGHLYEGKIPSTEANQPIAIFDIFSNSNHFFATVNLRQKEPIDSTITQIFTDCL